MLRQLPPTTGNPKADISSLLSSMIADQLSRAVPQIAAAEMLSEDEAHLLGVMNKPGEIGRLAMARGDNLAVIRREVARHAEN